MTLREKARLSWLILTTMEPGVSRVSLAQWIEKCESAEDAERGAVFNEWERRARSTVEALDRDYAIFERASEAEEALVDRLIKKTGGKRDGGGSGRAGNG